MSEFNNNEFSNNEFNNNEFNNNEFNNNETENQNEINYTAGLNEAVANVGINQEVSYETESEIKQESYPIYPTPRLMETENKPKKKGRFGRLVRFTAAAAAFGMIAGVAASGYQYFTEPKSSEEVKIDGDESLQLTSNEKQDANPTVIPANLENGIIADVSDVVDKVMPSIVAINSSGTVTSYDDFFGRQFNEPVQGSGSGIIIGQSDSDILIVTNNHVIADAQTVEIVFADESTAQASVKGADAGADLAVLEISKKDLKKDTLKAIKVASLGDSSVTKIGEMSIAIGNALGYGQSVTVGYISAVDRKVNIDGDERKLLQTDAAINPGNSGGALINTNGEVIGINSVKYASQDVEGMGYAIPITDAIPMINQLMDRKVLNDSEKGYLGINLENAQEVTEEFSQQFHIPVGVYIREVVKNSPAEKAGLKSGHVIVGINGVAVKTIDELVNILSYTKVKEEISLNVKSLENGEYIDKDIPVVLGERP